MLALSQYRGHRTPCLDNASHPVACCNCHANAAEATARAEEATRREFVVLRLRNI